MSESIPPVAEIPTAAASRHPLSQGPRAGHIGAPALIGIGLLGGVAAATIAPRGWARIGAGLFGAGALILRSAIGPVLVSAALTHWLTISQARSQRAPTGRPVPPP